MSHITKTGKIRLGTLVVLGAIGLALSNAVPMLDAWPPGGGGGGGNNASNKAIFASNINSDGTVAGVTFTKFDATLDCGTTGFDVPNDKLCTPWVMLYDVPDAIKTSTQGAVEAVLSMEGMLWTDTEASAMIGATGSGGSRAGIEVRITVDGNEMVPGQVVYADRLQYLSLTIPELMAGITPVTSEDPFVVGLFQRTKNAHAYHFYLPTPATELHSFVVEARGIVQCFKDGAPNECSDSGIDIPKFINGNDETIDGGTKAAIGKTTLVVEEHNNWAIFDDGV